MAGSSTVSRVVPATAVTMARSLRSRRFNRLDLPTFGAPARTARKPWRRMMPPRAVARSARNSPSARSRRASRRRGRRGRDAVLHEVDRGFEEGQHAHEVVHDRAEAAREAAGEVFDGDVQRRRRPRTHHVEHRLGLAQVEPAVEEGAQGELAAPGRPRALAQRQLDHGLQRGRAAVAMDLEDVLGGEGVRRRPCRRLAPRRRAARSPCPRRGRSSGGAKARHARARYAARGRRRLPGHGGR